MYFSGYYLKSDKELQEKREGLVSFVRGKKKREQFLNALKEYEAQFIITNQEEVYKQANRINDLVDSLDYTKQQERELVVELHVEKARTVAAQQVISELAARVANSEIRVVEENSGDYFPGNKQ